MLSRNQAGIIPAFFLNYLNLFFLMQILRLCECVKNVTLSVHYITQS
jgi:hypothetical protein